jgi:hypothetical protein
MTPADTIARIRNACGKGVVYQNGHGGIHPEYPLPCDEHNACDCSGAALWAIGVARWVRASHPWVDRFPPLSGEFQWIDTTRIAKDASGLGLAFRAFREALPGDLIVYGDSGGSEGHVGVVTEVYGGKATKIAHCSSGNYKATGDAIRETDVAPFWEKRGAIYARPIDYPTPTVGAV